MALLQVKNLSLSIGSSPVVESLSFQLDAGDTFGLVGESGCGKSLTSLAIMGLLEGTPVRVTGGQIFFKGQDLLQISSKQHRQLMGTGIAMIFQEPMSSLNPVYRVGDQIVEMIRQHSQLNRQQAWEQAIQSLEKVRIPDPKRCANSYPHQLSGGMRQRVVIAMALTCSPQLLIADEPTTALDVTVQAQILNLICQLQKTENMAMIMISHDLGVIAQTARQVAVMYRGRIVEQANVEDLFENPNHPYTSGLIAAIPDATHVVDKLATIPGRMPMLGEVLSGCAFAPRCYRTQPKCTQKMPELNLNSGNQVRCHYPLSMSTKS